MEEVMTEYQRLLTKYLASIGCESGTVFKILCNVWEEEATIEMLEFCRDNRDASPAELLEMSLKISSKYPTEDEEE